MGGDGFQMPRFFVSPEAVDKSAGQISITGEDVNHIKNVLRLARGDKLEISDGAGEEFGAVIDKLEKDRITALISEVRPNSTEPPLEVTIYQGIPKADKMDYIIQKCVELGVGRIVPVITERTIVRFAGGKEASAKTARWQKISLEASKQCGRGRIPAVSIPIAFEKALEDARGCDLRIIPYELENTNSLARCLADGKYRSAAVFIGPEGGFAEEEVRKAEDSGILPVTLGPRILRTETAGLAVLSILMYELGDMR